MSAKPPGRSGRSGAFLEQLSDEELSEVFLRGVRGARALGVLPEHIFDDGSLIGVLQHVTLGAVVRETAPERHERPEALGRNAHHFESDQSLSPGGLLEGIVSKHV